MSPGSQGLSIINCYYYRIAEFHRLITRGFNSYNCQFNLSKTKTNLDTEDQRRQAMFCGAVLEFSSREIFPNYPTYSNTNLYFLQGWPSPPVKPTAFICRYSYTADCRALQ